VTVACCGHSTTGGVCSSVCHVTVMLQAWETFAKDYAHSCTRVPSPDSVSHGKGQVCRSQSFVAGSQRYIQCKAPSIKLEVHNIRYCMACLCQKKSRLNSKLETIIWDVFVSWSLLDNW
jgi:hypothetical protein